MQAKAQFLPNVPGVSATDSMAYRIEALKVYLENILGDEPFLAAYRHLTSLEDDEDDDSNKIIDSILGPKKLKYVTLIHQLIVCEDQYYGN